MIIGLDVGGTHTDVVLLGEGGLLKAAKVPTDDSDLFRTVLRGLTEISEGIAPPSIQRIVLSTTLTTNAIVQNKIPPVGMIVSAGPGIDPEYFRTNASYYAVSGAIDHRGREIEPLNPGEITRIARQFQREGIRHVGVVSKFSIRNATHELQMCEILRASFDKVFMGHRISGNLNFARRIATTFLNTAVYPIHKAFYRAMQKSLSTKGLMLPIRILKADGGNMKFEASMDFPGQTILSGPAASVLGAMAFCAEKADTLVMDIGGTTTDMAVLIHRDPVLNPLGIELGGYKTLIRSLETLSIGLGGDSAVKLVNGELQVGPERSGPAMAYGGPQPTPTDALRVLGDLKTGDHAKAVRGLKPLAQALGLPVTAVAAQILAISSQTILSAAQQLIDRINGKPVYTVHELKEGYVVRPKTILVLGGPAPYFARHLAQLSNYKVIVVPRWQVANAIGAALARTTCEVTFLADTERRVAVAPEESFSRRIPADFDAAAAEQTALELLREKAIARGANPEHMETEVLESMQFNMVRGFSTIGKNFRVKVQLKPGLIQGYNKVIAQLAQGAEAHEQGAGR
ncbi:MAG: hydantoinase/oxoprolinase family protein [Desulfobacterales bacterium]|nr:MAG: hydantoinase/oxoprolinase family protein [Desulfobacterales bacterium]